MKSIKLLILPLIIISVVFIFYSCNDAGIVKPAAGTPVYIKTFGGSLSDRAESILRTSDGGLLISGYTISSGSGGNDGFALKLNNNGNTEWYKVFGGSADDQINDSYPVSDGGYIFVGETSSFSASSSDIYAVKLDAGGNLIWSKYYRIAGTERGSSVVQTADYGFLICGYTDGSGAGNNDALVIKIDFEGNVLWINTYGDVLNDYGVSIRSFRDNSIIMAGYTFSGGAGEGDISLIRLNANGNVAWAKYYGGEGLDEASEMQITSDNGYIISGTTYSFGLNSGDNYFLKTDVNGYLYWSRTFGGPAIDQSFSIKQAIDGKYISVGSTRSYGSGLQDVFLIKLYGDGAFDWSKTFGTSGEDGGTSIVSRSDTGFAIAGYTQAYGPGNNDVYAVTFNTNGKSCTSDNVLTPTGGSPLTILNEVTIIKTPVGTYETIDAGTSVISFSSNESTICSK